MQLRYSALPAPSRLESFPSKAMLATPVLEAPDVSVRFAAQATTSGGTRKKSAPNLLDRLVRSLRKTWRAFKNWVFSVLSSVFRIAKPKKTKISAIDQMRLDLIKAYRKVGTHGYLAIADKMERCELPLNAMFSNLLNHRYNVLRTHNYPIDARHQHDIDQVSGQGTPEIKVKVEGGWHYRIPKNLKARGVASGASSKDRVSLNVVADKALLAQLDQLFVTRVKGYYKTPDMSDNWLERHDPITMYLDEPLTPAIEAEIVKIVTPFVRSTKDVLPGRLLAPGMAAETSPTVDEINHEITRAKAIDAQFADAVKQYFTDKRGQLKTSAGRLRSVREVIDQYSRPSAKSSI